MRGRKFREARIEWWWMARPQFMTAAEEADPGVALGMAGVIKRVDKILPPFIEERAMTAAVASLRGGR